MKVIARPVGTGKTKELMDAVVEADGMLLTTNKRALAAKAQAYGFDSIEYFKKDFELELCGYSVATEE